MSEKTRSKKDSENRDNKTARMKGQTADPTQNADREGVHEEKKHGDKFQSTLDKNSKKTKPNDGKGPQSQ